ncbi:hypothetical protein [Azonexus sp.]|uniref:hypothetical protein n=1 Tax=Azonexus sp. TaxID=1872668 RepID=UPI0035B19212
MNAVPSGVVVGAKQFLELKRLFPLKLTVACGVLLAGADFVQPGFLMIGRSIGQII